MALDRLQKILARAGFGSRRTCELLIEEGRVTVDGQPAKLGDRADPDRQKITVDGVPIPRSQPNFYIVLNKPRGVISTTNDPQGRKTVLDMVILPSARGGARPRIYPVGRLDAESEGLILLTNDGELTQRLTHPSYEHPRVYRVLVAGLPDSETLERWQRGITLDGRLTRFDSVVIEEQRREEAWLRVIVHEGRKHMVRRIVAALGHPPKRLIRVTMGPLELGDLPSGKWRYLTGEEVRLLQREVRGVSGTRRSRPTGGRSALQQSGSRNSESRGRGSASSTGGRSRRGRSDGGKR